jgi:hypothetical protein
VTSYSSSIHNFLKEYTLPPVQPCKNLQETILPSAPPLDEDEHGRLQNHMVKMPEPQRGKSLDLCITVEGVPVAEIPD